MSIVIKGLVPPKKNSRRLVFARGRQFFIPSKRHEDWHAAAMWQLKQFPRETSPVDARLVFFFPDKRRRDLTNVAESVFDALVDANILEDDNCFSMPKVALEFGGVVAKNDARVEIEFTKSKTPAG
jgi:Holliday junction resolvase RusA-like endonuclease